MKVDILNEGTRVSAFLKGDIDHHALKECRSDIDAVIDGAHPRELVLDFGEVGFMDSSGIGLILGRMRKLQETGGIVRVTNAPESVKKIMKLAGL